MNKEKQYLKDYIDQINKKVKVYNDCTKLVTDFKGSVECFRCNNVKYRFEIFYNYYIVLSNVDTIRNIIKNSFNKSSEIIKIKLTEKSFKIIKNDDENLLSYVVSNSKTLKDIYNILYKSNCRNIDIVYDYLHSSFVNKDDWDNDIEIISIIEKDLTDLVNKIEDIINSIEMPYIEDKKLDIVDQFKDY